MKTTFSPRPMSIIYGASDVPSVTSGRAVDVLCTDVETVRETRVMADPLYELTAAAGFHVLKDRWTQKSHFGVQSQHLADNLKEAIKATKKAVPRRKGSFNLRRECSEKIDKTERERRWEASIYQRWSKPEPSPVKECWDRVIAFQVPLFASQKKAGWGYIDLMGIIGGTTPVVIELKKDPRSVAFGGTNNSESPLRMVLEAAAYAVALRVNWENVSQEFKSRLNELDLPADQVPDSLAKVRLVGVAPASYWIDWLPVTAKGRRVKSKTWGSFSSLLTALSNEGYPTSFLSLSGDLDAPDTLAAQPLKVFPLFV